MPGVRLNFGKRGTSVSLGGRGATMNLSKRGVRQTVGIPGSGMSYSNYKSWDEPRASQPTAAPVAASPGSAATWVIIIGAMVLIGWLVS